MALERFVVALLRIFLVMLFAILLVFQFLSLPGQFAHMAKVNPEDAYLRWPMTAISVFLVLCAQVVIVSTWRLLALVANSRIFSEASMVWVNAIVGAVASGWVVLAGVFLYFGSQADDPGMPMLMLLMLVAGAVVGLLMIVMRALLRQATALQTDMDAVL